MTHLRVAHIITKLELGGAQQNTLYTVSHLNRSVFHPILICGPGGMLDSQALQSSDIEVHFCPSLIREVRPLTDWRAYERLKQLLVRLAPDVVHTHSSKAGIIGRFAAAEAGVPLIIHTYHGFGFHRFQNPFIFQAYVRVEKRACRRTQHLIFVSEDNRNWASQLGLIGNCSVSLIRSGIEVDLFRSRRRSHDINELRSQLGIPAGAPLAGMIACLKPQKDPLTYVEAADLVMRQLPDSYFLLAGDGELGEAVRRRITRMAYPERFLHLGWRTDIASLVNSLDVLVLTSLWEGLPRIIPEATVAGIPVIASDIDGNREAVIDGKNGTLARPKDPQNFAEKIYRCLKEKWTVDPAVAEKFQYEFDIDRMVKQQEELYMELASGVTL